MHFAAHVVHCKLLISVVAVFFRRVEQIVDIVKQKIERALLIVERNIGRFNAKLAHYLGKLRLHLAEKARVFAQAAPGLAGNDHVRAVSGQCPVAQRHARNDVHFGHNVEYVVREKACPVEHRDGCCKAVGKNVVLADAAFKGKARAEQIRDSASAAVSAQPELDPAEVEAAAIKIIRHRVINAVGRGLEAHGMVGVCFLDRVRVADPFAAVAVAADNDRDKEGIVRQLFCRDDVSAGVGAALLIVEAEAFDSAVVAANRMQRCPCVLVAVGFVSERAHRKPQRHYRKLMVVGAGRVQEKRVGVSEFELPDILGLFLL